MIHFENVTKLFNGRPVINALDLHIEERRGIDLHTALVEDSSGKAHLVSVLDGHEFLAE